MRTDKMTGFPGGRHRLGVLPGLSSRSETVQGYRGDEIATAMATMDDESSNKQLVPLSRTHSKLMPMKNWTAVKSRDSDESVGLYFQNVTSRVASLEDANKAILEEIYRLHSNIRANDFSKKEMVKEDKRVQKELMETIRTSNDVVAQLTSRLRKAEEKLHQEKENVKNLIIHSKKLEQILFNSQKESDSQRDAYNIQAGDFKQRLEELLRRWEKNDRVSESIIDEFHQLKNKVEIQSMEFVHLQTELKQKSKRTEDELKQTIQQARIQQDTNSITEQNNIQLRHLLEARMTETRDAVNEIRSRITQSESNSRSQIQQLTVKLSDVQSNLNNVSHRRQEEMQNLEKSRQEQYHLEENERYKLQNKIQSSVEEMNDRLIQKEVRLREEALKKFVDIEKLFQKEENARMEFEKHVREDVDSRWSVQHRLYVEEMEAMKEIRRNDKSQQIHNFKKIDDCLVMLDKRIKYERKALEKVLLAEITKREVQSRQVLSQVEGVKEQLRVALSTLQEAISGLHMQTTKNKEMLMKELNNRLTEEQDSVNRSMRDVDARLTAISTRITQQEESLETRMNNFKNVMQEDYNEQLRTTSEWKSTAEKNMTGMKEILNEIPQELRETQERIALLKAESETKLNLESVSRMKESESIKKQIKQLLGRLEELDNESIYEKTRQGKLETEVISLQSSLGQMEQLAKEVKSNMVSRVNSEIKMRLEETGAIKRDLARLRVDVQPLLWEHNNKSRSFVKAPVSFLNEWGIYQCARWYDIKMRWLRLLDRSRKRKLNNLKPDFKPAVNSFVDMETGGYGIEEGGAKRSKSDPDNESGHSADDFKRSQSSHDRDRVIADTPLHDDISLIDGEVQNKPDVSRPESPNHAWYNQEKVLDENENKDGESNGDEENLPDRQMPDGFDNAKDDETASFTHREKSNVSTSESPGGKEGDSPTAVKTHSESQDDSPGDDKQKEKLPSQKSESSGKQSRQSKKSRASNKRSSPNNEDSDKKSASSRKQKSSVTPSRGNAYDMEGRK